MRDITDRKKAEEALKKSEERYKAIFESFHDVYFRTDSAGLIEDISPSVYQRAGYKPEEAIGRPVTDFYYDSTERDDFLKKLKEFGGVN